MNLCKKLVLIFISLVAFFSASFLYAAMLGQEVSLISSSKKGMVMCIDKNAYDQWTKAQVAKDNDGIAELLFAGKIWHVDDGTPALVLENGLFITKVRLEGGKNGGKTGWVDNIYIK